MTGVQTCALPILLFRSLLFSVAATIAYIAQGLTLRPGDCIYTGTPEGPGPLSPGDIVEVELEGIGVLSNPVVAASP